LSSIEKWSLLVIIINWTNIILSCITWARFRIDHRTMRSVDYVYSHCFPYWLYFNRYSWYMMDYRTRWRSVRVIICSSMKYWRGCFDSLSFSNCSCVCVCTWIKIIVFERKSKKKKKTNCWVAWKKVREETLEIKSRIYLHCKNVLMIEQNWSWK
jgi:hypothetical protein